MPNISCGGLNLTLYVQIRDAVLCRGGYGSCEPLMERAVYETLYTLKECAQCGLAWLGLWSAT